MKSIFPGQKHLPHTTIDGRVQRVTVVLVVLLTMAGCGQGASSPSARIVGAQKECRDLEPTGSMITFWDEESETLTVRATESSDGVEVDVFDCLLKALDADDEVLEEFWQETFRYGDSHRVQLPSGVEAYWELGDEFLGYFAPTD